MLSEPGVDFDGGELVAHHESGRSTLPLGFGDALIFASDINHEVTPVTRGRRNVLVIEVACEPPWLMGRSSRDLGGPLNHAIMREWREVDSGGAVVWDIMATE